MKQRKPLALLLLVCLALCLLAGAAEGGLFLPARAATSDEIQNQIDIMRDEQKKLQEKIDALEAQKSETQSDIRGIVTQKNVIEQQIVLLNTQIRGINQPK